MYLLYSEVLNNYSWKIIEATNKGEKITFTFRK